MKAELAQLLVDKLKQIGPLNPGLFSGKAGVCLGLYKLSRCKDCGFAEGFADDLLEILCRDLRYVSDTSFCDGLSGIGWCINELSKEGYVDGDIDDILYGVDACIYRNLNNTSILLDLNMSNGVCGYLAYCIGRLANPKSDKNSVQYRLLSSATRHLVDQAANLLSATLPTLMKDLYTSYLWEPPILLFELAALLEMDFYSKRICNLIKMWKVELMGLMPYMNVNRLHWLSALSCCNGYVQDEELQLFIDNMTATIRWDFLLKEWDKRLVQINEGAPYFIHVLKCAQRYMPVVSSKAADLEKVISLEFEDILQHEIVAVKDSNLNANVGLLKGMSGIAAFLSDNSSFIN